MQIIASHHTNLRSVTHFLFLIFQIARIRAHCCVTPSKFVIVFRVPNFHYSDIRDSCRLLRHIWFISVLLPSFEVSCFRSPQVCGDYFVTIDWLAASFRFVHFHFPDFVDSCRLLRHTMPIGDQFPSFELLIFDISEVFADYCVIRSKFVIRFRFLIIMFTFSRFMQIMTP